MHPPDHPKAIDRLLEIMRILRSDQGCPWDREQTLETLRQNLVEESYEVIDAIETGDRSKLKEELGDLLLQIVFQAQICSEEGAFVFDDVAAAIEQKLIRRHPHVFGDTAVSGTEEVLKNWERIKSEEKGEGKRSVVEGIPRHLPALHKAQQVQSRVARVGFDWKNAADVVTKLDEELAEVRAAIAHEKPDRIGEEIGDLLFTVVNLARFLGHNAEEALNGTVNRFMRRFREVESRAHADGRTVTDCSLEELDRYWAGVKEAEPPID